jgi:DNA mismatch repair protein MutS
VREEVAELLANKKDLLTITYFKLQKLFEKKYGKNTVVLMEIGTFFEVYEVNNDEEYIGKAKEIAELLKTNKNLSREIKKKLNRARILNRQDGAWDGGVATNVLERGEFYTAL